MKIPAVFTIVLTAASLAAGGDLPKGDDVLYRYVEVTGGQAAYAKLKTMVTQGNVEFVGQGVTGKTSSWNTTTGRSRTILDLAGIGKIDSGVLGDKAWQNSSLQGPRLLEGAELAQTKRMTRLAALAAWRDEYAEVTTEKEEEVEGKLCYRLSLLPKGEAKPETYWFDRATGLLVQTRTTLASPMGEMAMEMRPSDYREVNGIRFPHEVNQSAGPAKIRTKVEKIEINVDIPNSQFDPPAEIKALLNK